MIPVNKIHIHPRDIELVNECLNAGWISSEGPIVREFENRMAEWVGRKYGVAVSSGTAALDIAVKALEIGPGDEVILPTFTIISCATAIIRSGAKPVLVDADPLTWNMQVDSVANKISSKTRAVMAVHTYGLPVDMTSLLSLCNEKNIKVIEDAAELIGQTHRGRACGSFGDISILSFYANKHVTTGEGGMVLTDDHTLAERSRSCRNLCFEPHRRFVHEDLGWNYRMTSLQAALGVSQLERLDEVVAKKRSIGRRYAEQLSETPGLQLPIIQDSSSENIFWVFGVVLTEDVSIKADVVMEQLKQRGIETRPFFWPLHRQPVLKRMGLFLEETYPVAEHIANRGFYLPSGSDTTTDEIDMCADALREILRNILKSKR
jgi:perosamine synthetase